VAAWRQFLEQPPNSAWLALDGTQPVGFLSFAAGDAFDGADLLGTAGVIGINGAYVRPAYRGQGVAAALLDAAVRAYAAQGITSCAVNFESFNPEAAAFWTRYFTPVCLSLLRIPEWLATLRQE
jgi:GNAT superfamily N-acetyltransferase